MSDTYHYLARIFCTVVNSRLKYEASSYPTRKPALAASRIVLARYTHWWGTPRGFGPALDQIELRVVPEASERVRLLRRGETEAAWSLPAVDARQLRRDPLLTGIPAPNRRSIGLERSVRGIAAAATPPPVLSAVWLTTIGTGS